MSSNSISNYLGTFSGFWNWAIASGEITGENIWEGLKKGLPSAKKRRPLDTDLLIRASYKADGLEDIKFFSSVAIRDFARRITAAFDGATSTCLKK